MLMTLLALLAAASLASPLRATLAPDTVRYPVLNHGRVAGEMTVIRDGGSVVVRYIYTDRNRGQRVEARYRLSPSGDLIGSEMRSVGANGVAGEPTFRLEITGDSAKMMSLQGGRGGTTAAPVTRSAKVESGMYFRTGGIPWESAFFVRHLLKQPNQTARTFPTGTSRLEIVADTMVTIAGTRQRVRLAMVHGQTSIPSGVWVDERGEFVASDVQWFMTVRPGIESALPVLRKIELDWRNRQAEAIAQRLTKPAGVTVIRNGDVFDAERGVMMPRTTVVIRGDRI